MTLSWTFQTYRVVGPDCILGTITFVDTCFGRDLHSRSNKRYFAKLYIPGAGKLGDDKRYFGEPDATPEKALAAAVAKTGLDPADFTFKLVEANCQDGEFTGQVAEDIESGKYIARCQSNRLRPSITISTGREFEAAQEDVVKANKVYREALIKMQDMVHDMKLKIDSPFAKVAIDALEVGFRNPLEDK